MNDNGICILEMSKTMKLSKLLISMFSLLLLLSLTSVMDIRVLGDAHA